MALTAAGAKDYRGRYYYEKFKVLPGTPQSATFFRKLQESYLQGLMWCLAYYVKGCISWTWYFPYHYGPMLQDMTDLPAVSRHIQFDIGQPFRPFQQLLGCLPPPSKALLPRIYQYLMVNEDSPILEFYPLDFGIDQDGKKNPWEAVVLLDFIDERRLMAAEAQFCREELLSTEEKARNTFGKVLSVCLAVCMSGFFHIPPTQPIVISRLPVYPSSTQTRPINLPQYPLRTIIHHHTMTARCCRSCTIPTRRKPTSRATPR